MELSNQEGEIPIPINSNYGGGHGNGHGHMIHHHVDPPPPHNINITSSSAAAAAAAALPQNPSNGSSMQAAQAAPAAVLEDHYKKVAVQVRYRECLKNHAAAMGGNATDGCGEFMPSGEEGTIEALNCSACHCHRNFHRKEVEGDSSSEYHQYASHFNRLQGRKFILGPPHKNLLPPEALGYHPTAATGNILPSRTVPPHHMIMPYSYNIGPLPSESDEQEENAGAAGGGGGGMVTARPTQLVKKRFRTKFSQEQKEKMLGFAEKVGWKIQKQEESVVQQFCQEIGVKRRVLKVWMHNNKHNLAKKNLPPA